MARPSRVLLLLCALALPVAVFIAPGSAVAATLSAPGTASPSRLCDVTARWHCYGETVPAESPAATSSGSGSGYWEASDIEQQYAVKDKTKPQHSNPTVAVVDAFGYPNLASDLAEYRSAMHLPSCTQANGCLRILNENGKSSPLPAPNTHRNDDWTGETALDVDMVSAVCPSCNILVVEANADGSGDGHGHPRDPSGLLKADKVAASHTHWVSDSWGGRGTKAYDTKNDAKYLDTPRTILTVATGDNGHQSAPDYPSTSPYAVAVGGADGAPGGSFGAWSHAGSSCAKFVSTPTAQQGVIRGCTGRAAADVSALADGANGILTYDSTYAPRPEYGWMSVMGTSAAAPIVAALYAESRNHTSAWQPYANITSTPDLWTDITSGRNGSCSSAQCVAGTGWDGPTGIGMPLSPEAFALPLAAFDPRASEFKGNVRSKLSASVSIPMTAKDTAGNPQKLSHVAFGSASATGLPTGTSATVKDGHLVVSGTPSRIGSGVAKIAVTGRTPAGRTTSGEMSIPWAIGRELLATSGKVHITGHTTPRNKLTVALPTLHGGTTSGSIVHAQWALTWLLNGRVVGHGKQFRVPAGAAHERLRVRAVAEHSGYAAHTFYSAVRTIG